MKRQSVDQDTARLVKEMLWEGSTQEHTAITLGVSQASVSRIRSGSLHPDVPWPNGATGAFDKPRETRNEYSQDADRFRAFNEEMQRRILEAVNARRAESNLPLIPDVAPEYAAYMDAARGDPEFEASSLEKARAAESVRLAQIMQEFDALCLESTYARRQEELGTILSGTRRGAGDAELEALNPPTPLTYEKMNWDEVLESDPKNKLVAKALALEDRFLQEAICIVFYALRGAKKNWREEYAANQAYMLAERLRKDA